MKKILLINVKDEWLTNGGDRPSLGTLYLATWLKKQNVAEPQVIDLNHGGNDALVKRLEDFKPDIIGISLTTPQYEESLSVATIIKQITNVPIIGGGPHVTAMQNVLKIPDVLPKHLFDYVVFGQGESILEEMCRHGMPQNRILIGNFIQDSKNLDWLPMPDRNFVDLNRYSLTIVGKRAQPLMTSFGCPYHCTFCSEPILNSEYKSFSPQRVVDEIKSLKKKGIDGFIIYDDVYSINAKRAIEIADLLISKELDVVYRCTTRATDFIRYPQLASKLKESGCVEICIGLESADDNILKLNDKGMTVDANRKGIKAIKDAGIKCLTYMITGLPGCTYETEQKSLEFVQETEADEVGWYMLAPFPSTPLWVFREKYGVEIFEDEIIANKWDVAQCRAKNEDLHCYIDYSKTGGLNRTQIKELWLDKRNQIDKWYKSRGQKTIQDSENKIMDSVK